MKKLVFLCVVMLPLIVYGNSANNYIIGEYVIGSGGVFGAHNGSGWHSATIGQSFVGFMEGPNHFHIIGYWQPGELWVNVEEAIPVLIPTAFELHQNCPNPFNPKTTIFYDLPRTCSVAIDFYNIKGQRIRALGPVIQGPGRVKMSWYARDQFGQPVSSGIYMYQITASEPDNNGNILYQETKKMLLLK